MASPSPLHHYFDAADALFMAWGDRAEVVAEHASLEIEYAAIRKSAGLLDCPHHGLLRLTGKDRLDFLHRMCTQELKSMSLGEVRRAFLLTAQGRIIADLLVIHDAEHTLIDIDVHQVDAVAAELDKLLFTEDVQIENLTATHHRISLHGPKSAGAFARFDHIVGWRFRYDETGEAGHHLWAAAGSFAEMSLEDEAYKPIGWQAFNIARIEAGRPMFNIDFGPDSLPHETGVLDETVSFTKGCYRGQEIVARMQSRGHPAKVLVGFRAESDLLPTAGAPVVAADSGDADTVGAVTSSTYAPMLSQAPIGFAVVKWDHREVGAKLFAAAEGGRVPIAVHELVFYRSDRAS